MAVTKSNERTKYELADAMKRCMKTAPVESGDQLEIMIAQTILVIVFKCSLEKQLFFLNVGKFIYKTFIDRFSFPHMFKGF